jgi:hypothetical protein
MFLAGPTTSIFVSKGFGQGNMMSALVSHAMVLHRQKVGKKATSQ